VTSPRGLLAPFRRDRKRDFASGDGEELLASKVLAVLATEGATARCSGELPWRTAFGTPLQLLRHRNNDIALGDLARVYVRDALARWLPEVKLLAVRVHRDETALSLSVRFRSPAGTEGLVHVTG